MSYQKQGFSSGEPLKASHLNYIEQGIVDAEQMAQEAASAAANVEKGNGEGSTQQIPDGVADGFMFENNPNAGEYDDRLKTTVDYGATGKFASAFGGKTSAQGKRAHAEGSGTVALGGNAHSEGSGTAAIGGSSHAEGYATTAVGVASHAEGGTTQALSQNSHAEGVETIALNEHSHAEGAYTVAGGVASHAEGYRTVANGNYSHAGGLGTITKREAQHAIGSYNIGKDNTVFEIGNGTSETDRSNILEVYENGDIGINCDGEMYSFFRMFADFLTDKYKPDFVPGEYSAKIIVDSMSGTADLITKKSYKAGSTISFKYYINENATLKDGTWFVVCHTSTQQSSSIYEGWIDRIPVTKGQWLDYTCTLPSDGYIYFGAEAGQWGQQVGNKGAGYVLIDDFTITENDVSVVDTFNDGLNSKLFKINNRNAVVLGEGYQK